MDACYVCEYLKRNNKYLEETLIDGFVNERTVKYLPLYVFEYLAMNVDAQKIVGGLSENNLKIISNIIHYASVHNQDWVPLCVGFYHLLDNMNYSKLISEINNSGIDESLIENLLFISQNSGNYFEISSIDELKKLDFIRLEKSNVFINTYDPNVILLNKYGISYDKAYKLCKRYGKDVLKLPESDEKNFLLDIKNIIEGKGTTKEVFKNKNFIINIDSILRNYFSKIYSDSFYKLDESRRLDSVGDIAIYDAGVDFNMCIYSYGMATDCSVPQNYKDDWNRLYISTDCMCNSVINSWNMKTFVKHCIYGFDNFGVNELALLGPNDLGTGDSRGGVAKEINITNPYYENKLIAEVEFRLPNELINNTRFSNNEVFRSRRRIKNGKLERINPDYIVYLKKDDNFQSDSIWHESVDAARDFSIPIVIIDCEKCLLDKISRVEKCIEIFENRFDDFEIVSSIIEMIYTINSGYRDIAPELLNKFFDRDKVISYLGRIIQHIDEIAAKAPRTALLCIDVVLNTLDEEFNKVLKSPFWVDYARKQGHIVEKPHDVIELFKRKRKELETISNYDDILYHNLT